MEKLLKGRGGFCIKERDAVSRGTFSSWGVANLTTATLITFWS